MKKRYDLLLSLVLFATLGFMAFVYTPVWTAMLSDVTYYDTSLIELLSQAKNFINIILYFFVYSVVFYCATRFGVKSVKNQLIIFPCALIFYYVSYTIVSFAMEGGAFLVLRDPLYALKTLWELFLFLCAFPLLLDIVAHGVIIGVGLYVINKGKDKESLPMTSLISFSNPLQKAMGIGAIICAFFNVIERVIYDIVYSVTFANYLLPQTQLLEIALAYLVDILTGVVAYFVMLGFVTLFYSREKKEKADA